MVRRATKHASFVLRPSIELVLCLDNKEIHHVSKKRGRCQIVFQRLCLRHPSCMEEMREVQACIWKKGRLENHPNSNKEHGRDRLSFDPALEFDTPNREGR